MKRLIFAAVVAIVLSGCATHEVISVVRFIKDVTP